MNAPMKPANVELAKLYASLGAHYPAPQRDPITRERYERRRAKRWAAGLTAKGVPRKRPWQSLAGMTEAEREERKRMQKREWARNHPKPRLAIDRVPATVAMK